MAAVSQDFTPALGNSALTPLYDAAIALMTREQRWRTALLAQVNPLDGDAILDVGCGTGTFALMLKIAAPNARVSGLDPDADVLARAKAKADRRGAGISFVQGYARDADRVLMQPADKIVSTLVFHQVPMEEKIAAFIAMRAALKPGGELHIADYGLQRTPFMRFLFGQIQRLDGYENTTPNARGVLPSLMLQAGFSEVEERAVIPTPTGSISIYFARAGGVSQ
ncbi:MAG: class I SAM-dependent methyltransferase [Hyphomonadaceae bacterium]|nr:class I SAM-dependent methyltransferase [Hyphomonadaceae bacterium]